jgi:hypothetical protein
MWALSFALLALGVVFSFLTRAAPDPNAFGLPFDALLSAALLAFPTVGALVASRRSGNAIGWLFCVVGVLFGVQSAAYGWGVYALLARPGALPGAELAAWLSTWLFVPALFCIPVYLLLLFPDGRPVSRRWRPVAWLAGVGLLATTVGNALSPGRLDGPPFETVENPAGFAGGSDALELTTVLGFWPTLGSILLAGVSLVLRFRRAGGPERQQLKWFASAAALFAATTIVYTFFLAGVAEQAGQISTLLAFAGIPIAVGIAILRDRLYDIDLVINRTLVYGSLTVMLAALYFGSIVVLQRVFVALTGQQSTLAVVASTLAIAALFNPLRRRVRALVDRRFYRRKYDAAKTLETFSAKLRDETDLDALSDDLVGVVRETMQPAHASLWLRPHAADAKDERARLSPRRPARGALILSRPAAATSQSAVGMQRCSACAFRPRRAGGRAGVIVALTGWVEPLPHAGRCFCRPRRTADRRTSCVGYGRGSEYWRSYPPLRGSARRAACAHGHPIGAIQRPPSWGNSGSRRR